MLVCPCCDAALSSQPADARAVCAQCTAVVEMGGPVDGRYTRLSARSAAALERLEIHCDGCGAPRRGGEPFCGLCGQRRSVDEAGQWAEAMRRHNMLELLERAGEAEGPAAVAPSTQRSSIASASSAALSAPESALAGRGASPSSAWRAAAWLLVVSMFCVVVAPRAGLASSRQAAAARLRLEGMPPEERLATTDGAETTVRALLERLDVLVIVDWAAYLALAVWLLVPYFVSRSRPRTGSLLALGSFLLVAAIHSWWIPPSVSRDMTVRLAILMVLAYVTWRAFREPVRPSGVTA